jgi:hypothetical protein
MPCHNTQCCCCPSCRAMPPAQTLPSGSRSLWRLSPTTSHAPVVCYTLCFTTIFVCQRTTSLLVLLFSCRAMPPARTLCTSSRSLWHLSPATSYAPVACHAVCAVSAGAHQQCLSGCPSCRAMPPARTLCSGSRSPWRLSPAQGAWTCTAASQAAPQLMSTVCQASCTPG